MANERLTLDNPVFAQTLRQHSRSVPAYQPRPRQSQTTQDMMFVRAARPSVPVASVAPVVPSMPRAGRSAVPRAVASQPRTQAPVPAERVVTARAPKKRSKKSAQRIASAPLVLYVLAGLLFATGGYVAFTSFQTDTQVKAQIKQLQNTAAGNDADDTPTDEKPSTAAVKNYTVAPALARYLDIPKLKVHARVLPLGVKSDNTLKSPRNGYDVGWYDASSRPGENGAMLIDGHSNVLGKRAVFANLGKLVAGDALTITRGDGTVLTYRVRTVTTIDDDKVNMSQLLVSADTAKPGLNLITCAGDVIPGTLHLDKRTFVQAVLE